MIFLQALSLQWYFLYVFVLQYIDGIISILPFAFLNNALSLFQLADGRACFSFSLSHCIWLWKDEYLRSFELKSISL